MKSHVALSVFWNRRTLAVWALVGALALAGCSADAQPGEPSSANSPTASSASASAPASASASPAMVPATPTSPAKNVPVPELPEAAKEKTPEGAVAFTEFYVELMNYTWATNDIQPILKHTNSSCTACFSGTVSLAEFRKRNGLHVVGGTVVMGELWGTVAGNNGTAAGPGEIEAYRSYEVSGDVAEDAPAVANQLVTFTLVFESDSWKALSIESADN